MKKEVSVFLRRIVTLLSSIAKVESMAIKSKTSAIKARLILISLMKSKKVLFGSISNKIHSILNGQSEINEDQSKAIVLYSNALASESHSNCDCQFPNQIHDDDDDDDGKYPDLTHCLFDEEDFNEPGGSIIDLVKNSKEEGGADFSLEDEIDHVADLFIMRFHKQMRLQKLESFKRFQEMLERSV